VRLIKVLLLLLLLCAPAHAVQYRSDEPSSFFVYNNLAAVALCSVYSRHGEFLYSFYLPPGQRSVAFPRQMTVNCYY